METISDRISEILENMEGPERGKQTRLAEIAVCTKGLINQLLKNPGQRFGYEYAKNIERRLGYSVDWILHGRLPKYAKDQKRDASDESVDGEELIELMLLYRQATPAGRSRILRYARVAEKIKGPLRRVLTTEN